VLLSCRLAPFSLHLFITARIPNSNSAPSHSGRCRASINGPATEKLSFILAQQSVNISQSTQKLCSQNVTVPDHYVSLDGTTTEVLALVSLAESYHIAVDMRHPLYVGPWVSEHLDGPAVKVCAFSNPMSSGTQETFQAFIHHLKDHLSRIHSDMNPGEEQQFSDNEKDALFFQHQRIYKHAVLCVNFTTYYVQRDQDFINPCTSKCDIMVKSHEDGKDTRAIQPFCYAHILGVFHAQVMQ
jgi:hypothetical protein